MNQIGNEQISSQEKKRKKPLKTMFAIGAIATAFALAPGIDKSGNLEQASPISPANSAIDGKHIQLSWNMHNETKKRIPQIKKLMSKYQVDAALLQEVNRDDFRALAKKMPDHYMSYVMADAKSKPIEGGFGNLIISRQKPRDVRTISLDGTNILGGVIHAVSGFKQDIAQANTKLDTTRQAWLADRSAIAMTLAMQDGDGLKDVRVINSHIDGDERVHDRQFNNLLKFINRNKKDGRPAFFCGDLNTSPEEALPQLAEIGMISPQTVPTQAVEGGRVLDYCSYITENTVGLADVEVLPNPKTDHYPLIATWQAST